MKMSKPTKFWGGAPGEGRDAQVRRGCTPERRLETLGRDALTARHPALRSLETHQQPIELAPSRSGHPRVQTSREPDQKSRSRTSAFMRHITGF